MSFTGITINPGKVDVNGHVFDIPSESFCRVEKDKVYIDGVELRAPRYSKTPAYISFSGCTFEDTRFKRVRYVKLADCKLVRPTLKLGMMHVQGDVHGDVTAKSCRLACSRIDGNLKAVSSSIEAQSLETSSCPQLPSEDLDVSNS